MLFLSFFSHPHSLEPACTLPSLFFLTWPESPAIYLGLPPVQGGCPLIPADLLLIQENGEISAPELGA